QRRAPRPYCRMRETQPGGGTRAGPSMSRLDRWTRRAGGVRSGQGSLDRFDHGAWRSVIAENDETHAVQVDTRLSDARQQRLVERDLSSQCLVPAAEFRQLGLLAALQSLVLLAHKQLCSVSGHHREGLE